MHYSIFNLAGLHQGQFGKPVATIRRTAGSSLSVERTAIVIAQVTVTDVMMEMMLKVVVDIPPVTSAVTPVPEPIR